MSIDPSPSSTNKLNIVLDATMIDTYLTCPAKFNYRFNLNKSTTIKAKPLDKGGLIHEGFDSYFKSLKSSRNWDDAIAAGINQMNVSWADESDLEPSEALRCREVFLESCTVNKDRDMNLEILEVETPFSYILYEDEFIRIVMIGKIDLLVNDYPEYKLLPMDHKSYEKDFPVRNMTNQFCNYGYALKSNYLMVNRVGFQETIKPHIKHKRELLSYDSAIYDHWKKSVISWIKNFYVTSAIENEWPMNLTSCDRYNRLCEYYDLCSTSGDESRIYKLNVLYKDVPVWDVSKSLSSNGN